MQCDVFRAIELKVLLSVLVSKLVNLYGIDTCCATHVGEYGKYAGAGTHIHHFLSVKIHSE